MHSTRNVRTFLESQDNLAGPHNFKRCGFKVEVRIDVRSGLGGQLEGLGEELGNVLCL